MSLVLKNKNQSLYSEYSYRCGIIRVKKGNMNTGDEQMKWVSSFSGQEILINMKAIFRATSFYLVSGHEMH